MKSENTFKNLTIFFILAFVISWILWLPSVLVSHNVNIPEFLQIFGQFATFGPGLAAVIVLISSREENGVRKLFKNAWNWKFNKLWLMPILMLPAAMIALTLAVKLTVDGSVLSFGDIPAPLPIFILILFFVGGPLEEFGWRGYALPRLLEKTSFLLASIIIGLLHGLWHLPLHFMNGTVQSYIPIWEFVAVTTVGAVIYTWLFIGTKGSLTAMILHHWAANLSSALLIYWDTTLGRWIFFAVQFIIAAVIILIYRKRKRIAHEKLHDYPAEA